MRAAVLSAGLLVLAAYNLAVAAETPKKMGTIQATLSSPHARRSEGLVFIKEVKGKFKLPKKNPVMDQRKMVFTPMSCLSWSAQRSISPTTTWSATMSSRRKARSSSSTWAPTVQG